MKNIGHDHGNTKCGSSGQPNTVNVPHMHFRACSSCDWAIDPEYSIQWLNETVNFACLCVHCWRVWTEPMEELRNTVSGNSSQVSSSTGMYMFTHLARLMMSDWYGHCICCHCLLFQLICVCLLFNHILSCHHHYSSMGSMHLRAIPGLMVHPFSDTLLLHHHLTHQCPPIINKWTLSHTVYPMGWPFLYYTLWESPESIILGLNIEHVTSGGEGLWKHEEWKHWNITSPLQNRGLFFSTDLHVEMSTGCQHWLLW